MQYYRMDDDGRRRTTDRQAKEAAEKRIRKRNIMKVVWTLVIIGILAGVWFAFGESHIKPMFAKKAEETKKEAVSTSKGVGGMFDRSQYLEEEDEKLKGE